MAKRGEKLTIRKEFNDYFDLETSFDDIRETLTINSQVFRKPGTGKL